MMDCSTSRFAVIDANGIAAGEFFCLLRSLPELLSYVRISILVRQDQKKTIYGAWALVDGHIIPARICLIIFKDDTVLGCVGAVAEEAGGHDPTLTYLREVFYGANIHRSALG